MRVFVLLIALIISFLSDRVADACSCAPEHVQVSFCRAEFAIKAYIAEREQGSLMEDGTFVVDEEPQKRQPDKRKKDEKTKTTIAPLRPVGPSTTAVTPGVSAEPTVDEFPEPIVNENEPDGAGNHVGEIGADLNGEEANSEPARSEASPLADSDLLSLEEGNIANEQPPNTEDAEAAPSDGQGREIKWARVSTALNHKLAGLRLSSPQEEIIRPPRVAPSYRRGYISRYLGPDGAMPGQNSHFRGIRGKPIGLRGNYGPPSSSLSRNPRSAYGGDFAPGAEPSRPHGLEQRKGIRMVRYRVKILKVHKGKIGNGSNYVYTPPDSPLCHMNLTVRTSYVLLGRMIKQRLQINRCDYKIDLKSMPRNEARHLNSNLKFKFRRGCNQCTIDVCFGGECNKKAKDTSCVWPDMYTLSKRESTQFACFVKKGESKCKWFNVLHPDMTPDDLSFAEAP